jgi:hypothetical protein
VPYHEFQVICADLQIQWFHGFARKERIADAASRKAMARAEKGLTLTYTPIQSLKPAEIKAILGEGTRSQTVFANYLNVTSAWSASGSAVKRSRQGPRSSCYRWSRRMAWLRLHSWYISSDLGRGAGV